MDLSSTNGTFCNDVRVKVGQSQELSDADTLSFGGLHFRLKIVRRPGKSAGK
jgi:pSer/pThr/pTyr-binding forkhead associated (FHA) protein